MSDRHLLLVVGSGRSGTSLFSIVLRELGYHVPRPEVTPDSTNPKGFGESQWVVDFHTRLLREASVQTADARPAAWFSTGRVCLDSAVLDELRSWLRGAFAASDNVLIKDPRLLWFTPLWESAAAELNADVCFTTLLRHPAEVVRSKDTWYAGMNLSATSRTAGWINTMLATERATRHARRAFVLYDDLLADWTSALADVDERIGLPPLHGAGAQQLARVNDLVDPTLRRSASGWDELDVPGGLTDLADRTWSELTNLVKADDQEHSAELDDLRVEYRELYKVAERIVESSLTAAGRARAAERPDGRPPATRARRAALKAARLVPTDIRHRLVDQKTRNAIIRRLP